MGKKPEKGAKAKLLSLFAPFEGRRHLFKDI
jgi:hypothetical protein